MDNNNDQNSGQVAQDRFKGVTKYLGKHAFVALGIGGVLVAIGTVLAVAILVILLAGSSSDCSSSGSTSSGSTDTTTAKTSSDVHQDVSVDYDDATTPIGQANTKKLAKATAAEASKLYNITADPGLIYAQWAQESGPSFDANPTLNDAGHNLGGLSGSLDSWLTSKGVTKGSTHAEGDGTYFYFPDYKTMAEIYVSGLYKSVPEALKAGSKSGNQDADVTAFATVLSKYHYFTASVAEYQPAVDAQYLVYYNSSAGAAAASTTSSDSDDACSTSDTSSSDNNIVSIAKSMVGYFVGHYLQSHAVSKISDKSEADIKGVGDIKKDGSTDCSGYVWIVLKLAGKKVPANMGWFTGSMESDAKGPHKYLKEISSSDAKAGDVVICNKSGSSGSGGDGHTVILAEDWHGQDTMVYSMGSDKGVIYRANKYVNSRFSDSEYTFARAIDN